LNINTKGLTLLAVAVGGLVAGAYTLGLKQSPPAGSVTTTQNTGSPAPANSPTATAVAPHVMPSPTATASAPAAADPDRKFTHFRVGNRNVKSIVNDGELMWVGTSGGVIRYDTRTNDYKLFNTKSGLLSNGVFYVGLLNDQVAVGTYGGGLSLLNKESGEWSNYNVPQGLADAFVYEVLTASNGDVWIATWSGANRIIGGDLADRSKWITYTVENTNGGLPNDWVYGLDEGADGTIWLGTEGGLARFKDDQWENWQHKDGLGAPYDLVKEDIQFRNDPGKASQHHARQKVEQGLSEVNIAYNPNYIISMAIDPNGNVWNGTWGGGLSRFDGQQWRNFTTKDGLPSNHIFMLNSDSEGRLWIGSSAGLSLFNPQTEQFTTYTTADGLFSNNVFSIAKGSDGSRWIGSYGGVARIAELP